MAGLNQVTLIGNLTRDPDFRGLPNGMAVCEFVIAVNTGLQKDKPYFGQIITFGKTAEVCRQYLAKGSAVAVVGRLENNEWEDKRTGEKKSKTRIVAETVQFLSSRSDQRPQQQYQQQLPSNHYYNSQAPTAPVPTYAPPPVQAPQTNAVDPRFAPPPAPAGEPIQDDIPF